MIEVIDEKLKGYKNDLQKAVDEHNKKIEDDTKSINEDLAKKGATLIEIQDTLKQMQAKQGRLVTPLGEEIKSFEVEFKKALFENAAQIAKVSKANPVSYKLEGVSMDVKTVGTMTPSANLTGSTVAGYSMTPAVRGRRRVHFRDIPGVSVVNSEYGTWKFYRQDSPVGEGSFGVQTVGSAKSQLDFDSTEVTVTIDTFAGFTRIAKQMLRDLPFMASYLPSELTESYYRDEDNKFINTLMAQCAAYSTTASVYAEKLIEWASVLYGRDYDVTAFVTTAANWATLLTTKPADYSIPGGVTITGNGEVAVAGIPVVICNGMTGTKTFVGDFERLKILQAAGLSVQFFEQDSDNVQKNLITVRAEADVALATLRTDAFLYV